MTFPQLYFSENEKSKEYRDNFIKSTDGKLGILFLDFTDTKLSQIYEQQNVKTFDIFFFIFGSSLKS